MNCSIKDSSSSFIFPIGSTTKSARSTSETLVVTTLFMWSLNLVFALWMPGVSRKTHWYSSSVRTPVIRVRVVWGLEETMAIFSPKRAFKREDFPTFALPTMATKADLEFIVSPYF